MDNKIQELQTLMQEKEEILREIVDNTNNIQNLKNRREEPISSLPHREISSHSSSTQHFQNTQHVEQTSTKSNSNSEYMSRSHAPLDNVEKHLMNGSPSNFLQHTEPRYEMHPLSYPYSPMILPPHHQPLYPPQQQQQQQQFQTFMPPPHYYPRSYQEVVVPTHPVINDRTYPVLPPIRHLLKPVLASSTQRDSTKM